MKDTSNPNDLNAKYNNVRLGMNSRLDTLQAAVLIPKFEAFKNYELDAVNQVAEWYSIELSDANLILPTIREGFYSSWAQYTIQLPEDVDRKDIQKRLKSQGIPTMVYYAKPMHLQSAFEETDSSIADCPITERLCKTVLSLPMHPYMTRDDAVLVSKLLKDYLA